jgi:hypothetical protein
MANHLADVVDFAVALGALAQHDAGIFRASDVTGAERERYHIEANAERLDAFAQARKAFDGPVRIHADRRQRTADMIDTEGGQDAKGLVG